jgi:hypothetical protein
MEADAAMVGFFDLTDTALSSVADSNLSGRDQPMVRFNHSVAAAAIISGVGSASRIDSGAQCR